MHASSSLSSCRIPPPWPNPPTQYAMIMWQALCHLMRWERSLGIYAESAFPCCRWSNFNASCYHNPGSAMEMMDSYMMVSSQMSRKERIEAGHQLEAMLLDCSWRGVCCSPAWVYFFKVVWVETMRDQESRSNGESFPLIYILGLFSFSWDPYRNFTAFLNSMYGNCYTFKPDNPVVAKEGPMYGKFLGIFLQWEWTKPHCRCHRKMKTQ